MTTKSASATTPRTAEAAEPAPAKKPAARKPAAAASATSSKAASKAPAAKPAKAPAAKAAKPAAKTSARATKSAGHQQKTRSVEETEQIRVALYQRLTELTTEYDSMMTELSDLQRDRLTDSAGDDQADTGTKTFEREQEISLANGIRERVTQVERALERLDGGHYGYCERCGNPIPAERLAAFPSVTLCVSCKQLEERR